MAQLDGILALRILYPVATADAVFVDDILRVVIVQQRELQRQRSLQIRHLKMVSGYHRPCENRMTSHGESRQLYVRNGGVADHDVGRAERCQSFVIGKIDDVIVGMRPHTADIFFTAQATSLDIADEHLLTTVVLPESHRRGAPDVTIVGLYDIAHGLVLQHTSVFGRNSFLLIRVIVIQPLDGSYQYLAALRLTQ